MLAMRVLVTRSDARTFEEDRFATAWQLAGGRVEELTWLTPATARERLGEGVEGVAGLLLTGGPDVEPWRYGAAVEAELPLRCNPARDELDLELLRHAGRERWCVLAICYGAQLLVVSEGGSLVQDLPSVGVEGHAVAEPKDFLAHHVLVEGSAGFLSTGRLAVNSRHHQAAARVAGQLRVVGRADDGVIEAVEGTEGDRFVVGVQWHPENLTGPEHVAIFRAFRRACLERAGEVAAPGSG
jgi:putative glutamine amidotransferase